MGGLTWKRSWVTCILVWVFPVALCDASGSLSTADTSARVEATPSGITLQSLQSSGDDAQFARAGKDAGFSTRLISSAIVGGRSVQLHWKLVSENDLAAPGKGHEFVFTNDDPPLQAVSRWSAVEGPGPIEHALSIINRGKTEAILPLQTTLGFEAGFPGAGNPPEVWWVEKGAGRPSEIGVHRVPADKGFGVSLESGPYSSDNPHEPIPWAAVYDPTARRGFYVGVESSARVRIAISRPKESAADAIRIEAGLQRDDGYTTRLAPGETLQLPTVFVGCFQGDVDDGCNRLRHWVDANLRPRAHDAHYPLLVNNSWGNGMAIDEALCRRMIDSTADLGLEMYHIDAGWFRGVGDWRPNPRKFPNGLAPVADYAHSKGLKFGLWVGWTQGGDLRGGSGPQRPMSVFDPTMRDWFPKDAAPNWKPQDFTGTTVCLGDPPAADWCLSQLRRIIKDNKIDMLEHDQQMVLDECARTDHQHTSAYTDVSYRAAQGYYRIYDTLRAENPNLLFEDCVNGGRMVDYGIVRRAHYISITDVYDPVPNRRAFYDASFALPPAMCECYVENHPGKTLAQFKAMLRSGMMGWCTIMTDTSQWTPQQHAAAKRQFAIYKSALRPLIRQADLYHITKRPDGTNWDGIEYWDPKSHRGAVYVFRGTTPQAGHRLLLKGLDPASTYKITSEDGGVPPCEQTGQTLRAEGLAVSLKEPESSDLIFLQRK
ncbi:MAG TPA: glycoside hydrolase family 36 protein [Tepidisphaeraceae bacterium]|nr:glycoside hydrolase family 36 protein [Tepidisphaeraceae bacterium]